MSQNEEAPLVPAPTAADGPVFWRMWRERYPDSPLLVDAPPPVPPAAKRRARSRKGSGAARADVADPAAE